jgi:branched-chain amino acid transport system permease protein
MALVVCAAIAYLAVRSNVVWLETYTIVGIYALLALSVGLSYGQVGILSVAQAAFASIGAYSAAILTARYQFPPIVGLFGALVLPVLVAYPLARIVTGLSPLALAIATLVFGQAVDIMLRQGGSFTGGYIGLSGIPSLPYFGTPGAYALLTWGVVALVVFLYENLLATAYGRALATIRSDALRATADGVSIVHLRSAVLALSASIAGVAGWLYAHHITYVGPDSLNPSISLSVLLMAVIGGARTVLGPVVGAALLTIALTVLPAQEMQGMFYGATLILVLLLAPTGLLGAVPPIAVMFRRRANTTPVMDLERKQA